MNKEQIKSKMEALNEKMKILGDKTKDSIDTVKIKSMYAKDKVDEMTIEAKSKATSELIKAQMNIDAAKEELAARKEAHDKASLEKYIDDVTEYASACVELSILASQEAKLAALEVVKAEQEYEEKYGNE